MSDLFGLSWLPCETDADIIYIYVRLVWSELTLLWDWCWHICQTCLVWADSRETDADIYVRLVWFELTLVRLMLTYIMSDLFGLSWLLWDRCWHIYILYVRLVWSELTLLWDWCWHTCQTCLVWADSCETDADIYNVRLVWSELTLLWDWCWHIYMSDLFGPSWLSCETAADYMSDFSLLKSTIYLSIFFFFFLVI